MTISTATLLGLFALMGVCVVCLSSVLISLINARVRIEQESTEGVREVAYHLERAEWARLEAARYAVILEHERRVIAQADRADRRRDG